MPPKGRPAKRKAKAALHAKKPSLDPLADVKGEVHEDSSAWDVKLVSVNVRAKSEKYCVLQLIKCNNGHYAVFERRGGTGSGGEPLTEVFRPCQEEDAKERFMHTFEELTGQPWNKRASYKPEVGKYTWVQKDCSKLAKLRTKDAKWQYWVDDRVDGKADGWYDYDSAGSTLAEELHGEWVCNPELEQRVAVQSGRYSYWIDFNNMSQMNVSHPNRTVRHIRRLIAGVAD